MNPITNFFRINHSLYELLVKDSISAHPNEACGIVFGLKNHITGFLPVSNISTDGSKFILDPDEHIKALYEIDQMGIQDLGIYHSHPFGPDHPSETDIRENSSNTQTFFIISGHSDKWGLKAFNITPNGFTAIDIKVELSE
jgi:proteasome lid subunit RPN8/RPN11